MKLSRALPPMLIVLLGLAATGGRAVAATTSGAITLPYATKALEQTVDPPAPSLPTDPRTAGWLVQRLTPAGVVDTAFGESGTTTVAAGNDEGNSIAVGADGRLVAVGYTDGAPNVVGLSPSGAVVLALRQD